MYLRWVTPGASTARTCSSCTSASPRLSKRRAPSPSTTGTTCSSSSSRNPAARFNRPLEASGAPPLRDLRAFGSDHSDAGSDEVRAPFPSVNSLSQRATRSSGIWPSLLSHGNRVRLRPSRLTPWSLRGLQRRLACPQGLPHDADAAASTRDGRSVVRSMRSRVVSGPCAVAVRADDWYPGTRDAPCRARAGGRWPSLAQRGREASVAPPDAAPCSAGAGLAADALLVERRGLLDRLDGLHQRHDPPAVEADSVERL